MKRWQRALNFKWFQILVATLGLSLVIFLYVKPGYAAADWSAAHHYELQSTESCFLHTGPFWPSKCLILKLHVIDSSGRRHLMWFRYFPFWTDVFEETAPGVFERQSR